jgi:uncharacterized protein YcbK (DUF882 family)
MFKYFSRDEFVCKETGENEIEDELIFALDELREHCGFPFVITSGYRSPDHPIELKKKTPGTHAQGIAAQQEDLNWDGDPELDVEYECVEEKDLDEYVVKWFYD